MQLELFVVSNSEFVLESEEWKRIPDFPRYEVSSLGRFRNIATGQYLRCHVSDDGYCHIGLTRDGHQYPKLAHRIVALTFLEAASSEHRDVNHKNKVRTDNRLSNLEWVTRSYNSKHARNFGK